MEEGCYIKCKVIASGNSQLAVHALLFMIEKMSLNCTVLVHTNVSLWPDAPWTPPEEKQTLLGWSLVMLPIPKDL